MLLINAIERINDATNAIVALSPYGTLRRKSAPCSTTMAEQNGAQVESYRLPARVAPKHGLPVAHENKCQTFVGKDDVPVRQQFRLELHPTRWLFVPRSVCLAPVPGPGRPNMLTIRVACCYSDVHRRVAVRQDGNSSGESRCHAAIDSSCSRVERQRTNRCCPNTAKDAQHDRLLLGRRTTPIRQ